MTELKDKLKVYFDDFEKLVDETISECIEEDKIIEFGSKFKFSQNRTWWYSHGVLHDGKLWWLNVSKEDGKFPIYQMSFKEKFSFLTQLSEGVELKYSEVHGRENVFDEDIINVLKTFNEIGFTDFISVEKTHDDMCMTFRNSKVETIQFRMLSNKKVYDYFRSLGRIGVLYTSNFSDEFECCDFCVPTVDLINAKQKIKFKILDYDRENS